MSELSPLASWLIFLAVWGAAIMISIAFARWTWRRPRPQRMSDEWLRRHRNGHRP